MIKHISSGGFIFYKDKKTAKVFVILLKDKNNKYLIPKGHLEENEDLFNAAKREIEEEVGIKKENLLHLGYYSKDEYSWEQNNQKHTKTVHIYSFYVQEKFDLISQNEGDVISADWYDIYSAFDLLTYNKEMLKDAFQDYVYISSGNKKYESKKILFMIPTYNGGSSIERTVMSILKEVGTFNNFYPFSIYVCIDHSTDDTELVLENLSSKFKVVTYGINDYKQGKTNALNFIYKNNKADIGIIVDDDIVFKDGSVEKLIKSLSSKTTSLVFSEWKNVPYKGTSVLKTFWNYVLGEKSKEDFTFVTYSESYVEVTIRNLNEEQLCTVRKESENWFFTEEDFEIEKRVSEIEVCPHK